MTKTEFKELYKQSLYKAFDRSPKQYIFARTRIPEVAAKMMSAFEQGTANITNSQAFKILAKELNIKHTVKAITEFYKNCD